MVLKTFLRQLVIAGVVLSAALSFQSRAYAIGFGVLATGGYEDLVPEDSYGVHFKGYGLGITGQMETVDAGLVQLILGLSGKYFKVQDEFTLPQLEEDGTLSNFKDTYIITSMFVGAEAGAQVTLIPKLLKVQLVVGYDYGINPKVETKNTKLTGKYKALGRTNIDARILVGIAPFVDLGVSGGYKFISQKDVKGEAAKAKGSQISAVINVSI